MAEYSDSLTTAEEDKGERRRRTRKYPPKVLDSILGKPRRGRKGVRRSEVCNRAEHYRALFENHWNDPGESLLRAEAVEDVLKAFKEAPEYLQREFGPDMGALILKVLREPKFPKYKREAQIAFLADSLAARGLVSPRRSRDICYEERAKPVHFIVRQDYYIQCTCKYKGPALHGKCPKCGTERVHPKLLFRLGGLGF